MMKEKYDRYGIRMKEHKEAKEISCQRIFAIERYTLYCPDCFPVSRVRKLQYIVEFQIRYDVLAVSFQKLR